MKRKIYYELLNWKNNPDRKPLLLQGARQVGKTYIVKAFGKDQYRNFHHFNFEKDPILKTFFKGSLDPKTILDSLSLYIGKKIENSDTLIFFDEIQVSPEAITSLKYFCEEASEYHLIAAGSLLGVSVGKKSSFPVGKVDFMTLFPMSFSEYLSAFGDELLADEIEKTTGTEPFLEPLHNKLIEKHKLFLYLGGMPEVLQSYLKHGDIAKVRNIQNSILDAYKRDFSKYAESEQAIKTSEIWNSIPYQLAKENKKFKYSDVRKNSRASTFENSIEWLKNAGLIYPAYNISTPKLPVAGYTDRLKFKLYMSDTGLLGAMLNLTSDIIVKPAEIFSEYNGAFIENYVATELMAKYNKELFYWTSKNDAEVDYVIVHKNNIYPVEVKSGLSGDIKSLRSYQDKYKPRLIVRLSPKNFVRDKEFINIPLYAAAEITRIIGSL
ncbi:MAG: ATP-binding protein [Candidatus Delongbacteria bacterium]|jgi:predicted AAA+ superfamily ATPase|nr:ATP-binding protein [Candidatus Delongbacteria bacterium]MDD4205886.1 ATP-binding protein [Candidatus Delongbacteria bacterium]